MSRVRIFYWMLLAAVLPNGCVPRKHRFHGLGLGNSLNMNIHTYYNQKQSGDGNNTHLALKDFQVILFLGGDTLGSLGEYDFSDLPAKPGVLKPSTDQTPAPAPPPSSSTPIQHVPPSTLTPTNRPYPILTSSTIQPPKEDPPTPQEETNKTERYNNQISNTTNAGEETEDDIDDELGSLVHGDETEELD